jgi:hypothetical protein
VGQSYKSGGKVVKPTRQVFAFPDIGRETFVSRELNDDIDNFLGIETAEVLPPNP